MKAFTPILLAIVMTGTFCPIGHADDNQINVDTAKAIGRCSGLWFPSNSLSWVTYGFSPNRLAAKLSMSVPELELFLKTNEIDLNKKVPISAMPASFFDTPPVMVSPMTWPQTPPKEGFFLLSYGAWEKRLDVMILVDTHPVDAKSRTDNLPVYRLWIKAARFTGEQTAH